jgi:hypothetical protein
MSHIKTGYWKFDVFNVFGTRVLSSYALEQTPLEFIPTVYEAYDYSEYYILWNFGDGTPAINSLSASHSYYYPGQYTVTMTVMLSTGEAVIDTYNQKVTISDFIPNTFAFKQLSGVNSTQIYLTAGVYSPELTIERFNSLQTYSSDGYTFFLNVSGSDALYYDTDKLYTEPYAHLLPTHRFIVREPVNIIYSDSIVHEVTTTDTNLYGKLDTLSLVVPTSSTDVNAFFVGTSGYSNVYFVDDAIKYTPYYIFCTIDTSNFPDNYTHHFNLPANSELPIKNSNSSYYTIAENVYANADKFNITSNGLDGEGFILSSFNINPVKYRNQKVSFVAKLKYSNGYTCKTQYNTLSLGYTDAINNISISLSDVSGNILNDFESYITCDTNLFTGYNYGWIKGYFIVPSDDSTLPLVEDATVCLSAYGYVRQSDTDTTYWVSGSSTPFHLYPKTGYNKVAKVNENFDMANYMKGLAYQPAIYKQPVLFDTFFGTILGTLSSNTNSIGKRLYEKTSNFVKNTSNIDTCNVSAIYGFANQYNIDINKYLANTLLINYPSDIARLVDIFSIKQSILFGRRNQFNLNFDNRYDQSMTNVDLDTATQNLINDKTSGVNLGSKLDMLSSTLLTSNEYIVAHEPFSNVYRLLRINNSTTFNTPLTSYTLSTFSSSWGWGLTLPDSLYSDPLLIYKLSSYYTFYNYIPVVKGEYLDNLINWDDDYNTTIDLQGSLPLSATYLPMYLNNYNDTVLANWSTENGIVDQNFIYQLSLGVEILSSS